MLKRLGPVCLVAITLSSCAEVAGLPAIHVSDRIVIGQLKSTESSGEITSPEDIAKILAFANRQRAGTWSTSQSIPGRCTLLLRFMSGENNLGYFAIESGRFVTHGPSQPLSRGATFEESKVLLAMIPPSLYPPRLGTSECAGTVFAESRR